MKFWYFLTIDTPALMGNTVLWKPSTSAVLSSYIIMKAFMDTGLPDGVINFIPCNGSDLTDSLICALFRYALLFCKRIVYFQPARERRKRRHRYIE